MYKAQIKQLNKKIDKLLIVKKLPTLRELDMPIELIKKYGLATKTTQ